MKDKENTLVSIVGPTAVGKTSFAIKLANHFRTEIISADSRQFYKEMEIGTAKPSLEELAKAKHHFINSHSIENYYSSGRFEEDALSLLEDLFGRYQVVVVVGGSGLYLKALWEGMDEVPEIDLSYRQELNKEFAQNGLKLLLEELEKCDPDYFTEVDRQNHQRVIRALEVVRSSGEPFSTFRRGGNKSGRPFRNLKIGLEMDREDLYDRINRRMDQMIADGLFEEAGNLILFRDHNALKTVGYSEIFGYLDGNYEKEEAVRLLKRNSRRYAKRQMTWFKKDPEIIWIHPDNLQEGIRMIENKLNA